MPPHEDHYNAIHSYFIGPKGSNMPDFRANINMILDELLEARLNYFPQDNSREFIPKEVRRSKQFRRVRANLSDAVRRVAQLLGEHSVPFWSPRYQAHMLMDLTMPSLLGYFMTMLYNPNNVALEASPLTTTAELKVGQQLCRLFGYNTDETKVPVGWGHIASGGTVANLESIWVARNLKFYPLALSQAIKVGKLRFLAGELQVTTCQGEEKLFAELTTWELLNLRPEAVLDLPQILNERFQISKEFLQQVMDEYNIQTVGRDPLERFHNITKPSQLILGKTRHYSWPKGAAVAGIGAGNITEIEVDLDARVDLDLLKAALVACAENQQAVYAVVAIIGSTEEGAVDSLSSIVEMRKEMQAKYGLSFLIHADAAWGGYFATMLDPEKTYPNGGTNGHANGNTNGITNGKTNGKAHGNYTNGNHSNGFVPALYLRHEAETDLRALRHADSITVDPHKAGYIPYPAGSLVYRDSRMRFLVTWSAPVLSQGSADNIGIYGVEGSKPGAAAMSTWLSNQTIGLNPSGYGMLLGEAAFTSARLSAYYATMSKKFLDGTKNDSFICIPFNRLPSEVTTGKPFLSDEVDADREWIRNYIIGKDNDEVRDRPKAMEMLRKLGSDLNVNAFALNWYDEDGTLNTDLEEANYLMKRVVDRLSITSVNTDPTHIPLFLTSTKFEPGLYGRCAQHFMGRMGVTKCQQDVFVLRNVVMSPFPTHAGFIHDIMQAFETVIREEVEVCRERNRRGRRTGRFLLQGTDEPFLVLHTSFHSATLRQQLIFAAELDDDLAETYATWRAKFPDESIFLESIHPIDLETIDDDVDATGPATIDGKIYRKSKPKSIHTGEVTLKLTVKSRPLNCANRDVSYPEDYMPFYLYGTPAQQHICHMLLRAPNISLCASNVSFSPELPEEALPLLGTGLILTLPTIPEASRQPFPKRNNELPTPFFFRSKQTFPVQVWKDPKPAQAQGPGLLDGLGELLYTGTMVLGAHTDVDAEGPNHDQFDNVHVDSDSWQRELDKIGEVLNDSYRGDDDDEEEE